MLKNSNFLFKLKTFKLKTKKITRSLFLFTLIVLSVSLLKNYLAVKNTNLKIEKSKNKVQEMREKNEELKKKLELAQSEEYVEKQLRDKLGLAREGEIVIVLPDDEILRKFAPDTEFEEDTLPDPNWKKWLDLFM